MGGQVKVCGIRGEVRILDLCDTEEQLKSITVLQLKKKIEFTFGEYGDLLVFRTEPLEEGALLSDYGIQHMSTIYTLTKLPGV